MKELVHWLKYRKFCRLMQHAFPGMHDLYSPLSFRRWKRSELNTPRSWRSLLWPGKITETD